MCDVCAQALAMPAIPGGAALQTCSARCEFARRFPANYHEGSAQTGIGRIGRPWAALRSTLLSITQAPFSTRARVGFPENTRKRNEFPLGPPGGPGQGSIPGAELKDGWWLGILGSVWAESS